MEPAARCCALGGPCSVTSPGQTARLRSATLSPRCPSSLPANGRCHPVAPFPCFRCPCLLRQPCPRPLDTRFHVPPPEDQVQQPLPIHLAPRGMKHPLRAMPDPVAVEGDFRAHGSASSRVARARASASSSAIRSNIDVPPAGVRRRSSHCSSLLARVSSLHRGSPGACMACATRVTRRCSLSCVFIAPSVFSTKRRPRPPGSGLPYPRLSACKPPRESRRLHLSSLREEGARGIHRQDIPRNSGKEPVRHGVRAPSEARIAVGGDRIGAAEIGCTAEAASLVPLRIGQVKDGTSMNKPTTDPRNAHSTDPALPEWAGTDGATGIRRAGPHVRGCRDAAVTDTVRPVPPRTAGLVGRAVPGPGQTVRNSSQAPIRVPAPLGYRRFPGLLSSDKGDRSP